MADSPDNWNGRQNDHDLLRDLKGRVERLEKDIDEFKQTNKELTKTVKDLNDNYITDRAKVVALSGAVSAVIVFIVNHYWPH